MVRNRIEAAVSQSPIEQVLEAIDELDLDRALAAFAPQASFLAVDGRRAEGAEAIRELVGGFLATLRSTSHRITAQWQVDGVWIAEVLGTYELKDWLQIKDLPRAFILRTGPEGVTALHAYGAHEHPLDEHDAGVHGMWVGGRLIPPL